MVKLAEHLAIDAAMIEALEKEQMVIEAMARHAKYKLAGHGLAINDDIRADIVKQTRRKAESKPAEAQAPQAPQAPALKPVVVTPVPGPVVLADITTGEILRDSEDLERDLEMLTDALVSEVLGDQEMINKLMEWCKNGKRGPQPGRSK